MSAGEETLPPRQPAKNKRKTLLSLLAIVCVLAAIGYFVYWLLVLSHYQQTDDAYVSGNQVQIMPQVSGSVTKVWFDNTDYVKQGDILVSLDKTDAQQAYEKAVTGLATSVRQTRQAMINSKQYLANITLKKSLSIRPKRTCSVVSR